MQSLYGKHPTRDAVFDRPNTASLEDIAEPKINDVDWADAEVAGLDPIMVSMAVVTDHQDAKLALATELIQQHHKHKQETNSRIKKTFVPEHMINRLVLGMVRSSSGSTPNAVVQLLALRLNVPERPRNQIQDTDKRRALGRLLIENPDIGKKRAAQQVGISPNTAKKWMEEKRFKEVVERAQNSRRRGP